MAKYLDKSIKESGNICPFCGSHNVDSIDSHDDSEKKICRDCEEDFIVWYNEDNEITEITTRNNLKICQDDTQGDDKKEDKYEFDDMDMIEVKVNMPINISRQCVDDILATAFEGGITDWCDEVKLVGDYLGEYASEQISLGGKLLLHDKESNKYEELTLEKFIKGFVSFIEEGGNLSMAYGEIDTTEIDAEIADYIVQCALFGELIYS